ncbi:MAG: 30S ribosomal protein S8 [Proteobacteria bacterium]|nr:MAG: 30S ribosomal protein S8 [Pseudomonadota bacterium]
MSMSDPIADMLTRIRNGLTADKREVLVPASRTKSAILRILKQEGYITDFSDTVDERNMPATRVVLKYFEGRPVIEELKRISKPGRRVYRSMSDLESVAGGLGVAIVSTSKGMMTEKQARQEGAGGEVVCTVF